MQDLDIEGLQALVDDGQEFLGEIVARLQVSALDQVQGAGLAGLDLLADVGRSGH